MPLTEQELEALQIVGQAFNAVASLPQIHKADLSELVRDIHNIQNRILARPALRQLHDDSKS